MATHSSTLAWKIPWMEEPGRQQSMGSLGVTEGSIKLAEFSILTNFLINQCQFAIKLIYPLFQRFLLENALIYP